MTYIYLSQKHCGGGGSEEKTTTGVQTHPHTLGLNVLMVLGVSHSKEALISLGEH